MKDFLRPLACFKPKNYSLFRDILTRILGDRIQIATDVLESNICAMLFSDFNKCEGLEDVYDNLREVGREKFVAENLKLVEENLNEIYNTYSVVNNIEIYDEHLHDDGGLSKEF